jgi:molecular chaperone Hsp33
VLLGVFVVPEGHVRHAGGLLVEVLPGVGDDEARQLAERVRSLGTITTRLREGDKPAKWLTRLFPDGCQVLGRTPVRFLCGCSIDRVERALKLLGAAEIRDMLASEDDPVTVECQFCRQAYEVRHVRLRELLDEVQQETGSWNDRLGETETSH